mgnify:CR=1 FL=1
MIYNRDFLGYPPQSTSLLFQYFENPNVSTRLADCKQLLSRLVGNLVVIFWLLTMLFMSMQALDVKVQINLVLKTDGVYSLD